MRQNNYYPFGLKHEGYNTLAGNPSYQYKYQGKELQETGMYDYGARFYMPDVGRFFNVDPLAEQTPSWSPYAYGFNNPIRFVDPTGMSNEDWVKQGNRIFYDPSVKGQDQVAQKYEGGQSITGYHVTQNNVTTHYDLGDDGSITTTVGSLGFLSTTQSVFGAKDINTGAATIQGIGGGNDGSYIRETPNYNSPEYAMSNPSGQLAVAGLYGLQIGTSEIAASKVLGGAANFIGFGKGAGRVFWSGGDVAKNAAADYAVANGGRTLEMTWVGRGLEYATEKTSYNTMKPFWDYASYSFGRGTQGTANVFINQARYSSGSIWNTVERPLLQSRGININANLIK